MERKKTDRRHINRTPSMAFLDIAAIRYGTVKRGGAEASWAR
jgi:hypothetical protein